MKINQADLIHALYWFYWVQYARMQGLPQEYIDKQAIYRVDTFRNELSTEVREFLDETVSQMKKLSIGEPENQMSNACRYIIQQADAEDYKSYITTGIESDWKRIVDESIVSGSGRKGSQVTNMKRINNQKKKLESAISYYKTKLNEETSQFREYAQRFDVENIIAFLPLAIQNIQDTQRQLRILENKMKLLSFFDDSQE